MKPVLYLLVVAFVLSACESSTINNNENVVFPDPDEETISYQNHVYPFFKVKCAFAGCHGDIEPAGGRRMTDYFRITDPFENPGLIVPGNPDGSIVIQMMERRLPHVPNFREDYFTQNQIEGMRAWIEEGAKNN